MQQTRTTLKYADIAARDGKHLAPEPEYVIQVVAGHLVLAVCVSFPSQSFALCSDLTIAARFKASGVLGVLGRLQQTAPSLYRTAQILPRWQAQYN